MFIVVILFIYFNIFSKLRNDEMKISSISQMFSSVNDYLSRRKNKFFWEIFIFKIKIKVEKSVNKKQIINFNIYQGERIFFPGNISILKKVKKC